MRSHRPVAYSRLLTVGSLENTLSSLNLSITGGAGCVAEVSVRGSVCDYFL